MNLFFNRQQKRIYLNGNWYKIYFNYNPKTSNNGVLISNDNYTLSDINNKILAPNDYIDIEDLENIYLLTSDGEKIITPKGEYLKIKEINT